MAFEEKELKNGQKLITKIWNVCQFVKLHIQEGWTTQQDTSLDTSKLYPTDQRILSRLNITIAKVMKAYENYEVGLAKIAFEEFFWHDFCDNYLEIIKNRLYKPETVENGEELKKSAQIALSECFRAILRLIAPIVPHISEELYQDIFKSQYNFDSIHLTPLPSSIISEAISLDDMLRIISDVRGYKTSHQLSLGAEIQKLTIFWPQSLLDQIKEFEIDILGVAKAQEINYKLDSTYHIEITQ